MSPKFFSMEFIFQFTCLNVNNAISGFLTMLGGLSGRRGLSGPISDPLDSESCIRSRSCELNVNCFLLCNLLISSVIFCAIFSTISKKGKKLTFFEYETIDYFGFRYSLPILQVLLEVKRISTCFYFLKKS